MKSGIAIYSLAVIGSRLYLAYTAQLSADQWAALIGTSESACSSDCQYTRQCNHDHSLGFVVGDPVGLLRHVAAAGLDQPDVIGQSIGRRQ